MACACTETTFTTKSMYGNVVSVDLTKTQRVTGTVTIDAYYNFNIYLSDGSSTVALELGSPDGMDPEYGGLLYAQICDPVTGCEPYTPVQIHDGPLAAGTHVRYYLCWDAATGQATGGVEVLA